MILKAAVAVVALAGGLTVAEAKEPSLPHVSPDVHAEVAKGGTVNGGSLGATEATSGWNYVHATNCWSVLVGTSTLLYVFPQEGGYWFTGNPVFQNTIAPACQTGNIIAFYVFSSSGSTVFWDQVLTFTFK